LTGSIEDPVRIAVVGAGGIGQRHLEAMSGVDACQSVAVVDPSDAGAAIADKWSVPHFTDIERMLDDVRPQGVINATPNALHLPLTLPCIERGIPVLVEKPVADNLEAACELADASEAAGVPVLVGHHRRHNPIVAKAHEMVQSGILGQLKAISANWLALKPDDYFDIAWRREPGGGPALINLIHDIDSLRFIAGDIVAVQGMTSNAQRGYVVEDTAAILLRFANGALATVMLSDTVAAPWSWELTSGEITSRVYPQTGQDCYFFAGTEASLAVPSLRLWRHEGAQSWESPLPEESFAVENVDPIHLQARHFADVIRGEVEPLITARDAARTLEATLAIVQAANTSSEVELSG
jgi:predicted dehydrogenase